MKTSVVIITVKSSYVLTYLKDKERSTSPVARNVSSTDSEYSVDGLSLIELPVQMESIKYESP